MSSDLEARLDRLESRAALSDLAAKYCRFIDAKDLDSLSELFDPAVVFNAGGITSNGWDATRAFIEDRLFHYEFSFHFPHTQVISFDETDADRASAVITAHAEHAINKTCVVAALTYEDTYRRTDGVWRISSRTLTSLYFLPLNEFVGGYLKGASSGRPA